MVRISTFFSWDRGGVRFQRVDLRPRITTASISRDMIEHFFSWSNAQRSASGAETVC
jgi:hypothetical protein